MKKIVITENKSREDAMRELEVLIRRQHGGACDTLMFNKAVECIDSYFERLSIIGKTGTTAIDLRQSFVINDKEFIIWLKHPTPSGVLNRLSRFFGKQ